MLEKAQDFEEITVKYDEEWGGRRMQSLLEPAYKKGYSLHKRVFQGIPLV